MSRLEAQDVYDDKQLKKNRKKIKLGESEKEIEGRIIELFKRYGFHVEKTDAGLVKRGLGEKFGTITEGFPDLCAFHPSGNPLLPVCLLLETKTAKGKAREKQVELHKALKFQGIEVQIVRSEDEALDLIWRVRSAIRNLVWTTI